MSSSEASFDWKELDKFGIEIPDEVKEILIKCGYKTESALRLLNKNSVIHMEDFLKVKILPVNKDIILRIPVQISEMTKSKNKAPDIQKTSSCSRLLKEGKTGKKGSEKLINQVKMSQKDLKEQLISKLKKLLDDLGFQCDSFNVKHITIESDSNKATCLYVCSFCSEEFAVKYNEYWHTTKIKNHLNTKHTKSASKNVSEKTLKPVPEKSSSIILQRKVTSTFESVKFE